MRTLSGEDEVPRSKRVTPPASGDRAGLPKPDAITVPDTVTTAGNSIENSGGPAVAVGSSPAVITQAIEPANRRGNRALPPIATRFKKGTSGNPNGRPKGIFSKAVLKQLRKRAENGETNLDAVVGAQVDKAIAKGDTRAAEFCRDTVDGRPASQDDNGGVNVGLIVQLEVVGK